MKLCHPAVAASGSPHRDGTPIFTRRSLLTSLFLPLSFLAGCDSIPEDNLRLAFEPADFELSDFGDPLRVLVIGDFGWGGKGQASVAKAIAKVHASSAFHFGITVGDNFYEHGVQSTQDKKWAERWEAPYAGLGIQFFPTLGNHDYYGRVQAQLDYQSPSNTWRFPSRQYQFRTGSAEFFALDTMDNSPEQIRWFADVFARSTARWKIVYGHHPIYSAGKHGGSKYLERELLPLIRGRSALYIAGHDHDMQHLKPEDGTHFIVSGGGGAKLRAHRHSPRTIFGAALYGFTVLEIHASHIEVLMYDSQAQVIYRTKIRHPSELEAKHIPVESRAHVPLVLTKV
jgi:tartrate-resistant acid phosphatase type 5